MLEAAIILTVVLAMFSWMNRLVNKHQAARKVAMRDACKRIRRSIAYCERLSRQCAFPLPNSMQIILLKRMSHCWWTMHQLGDLNAKAHAHTCDLQIHQLQRVQAGTSTYPIPSEGPERELILQSLYLLDRFLTNELKSKPNYAARVLAEKQTLEDVFLCGRVTDLLNKATRALALNALGSARGTLESADQLIRANPHHSVPLAILADRVADGLNEVSRRFGIERRFQEEPVVSEDGLERMFQKGKARWS